MSKKIKYTGVKVMPEFSSDGTWDMKTGIMISHDLLDLPKSLCDELYKWMEYYDTCFKEDYSTFKRGKSKRLNDWGMDIAKKLRAFLPAKIKVYYMGEDEKGVWDPRIIG